MYHERNTERSTRNNPQRHNRMAQWRDHNHAVVVGDAAGNQRRVTVGVEMELTVLRAHVADAIGSGKLTRQQAARLMNYIRKVDPIDDAITLMETGEWVDMEVPEGAEPMKYMQAVRYQITRRGYSVSIAADVRQDGNYLRLWDMVKNGGAK